MEIWGGIECTINRVGDDYFDQLAFQNHYKRPEDIELLIGLGIKKMRYPILWEKHGEHLQQSVYWETIANNLNKLRAAGVEVIAGLVHHGSGPLSVDMRHKSFVDGLASFAKEVAVRFPWIKYYTPINEPLTTARFCGLYGLWHPHGQDNSQFVRILVQECKATLASMAAIREVNPAAELMLTEDLGKIHSTALLQYQAAFENERKWLGIDLICGKVDETHALRGFLLEYGISVEELEFFTKQPCMPSILGFNYYITSERYLDENVSVYPPCTRGGNKIHSYADVEAVRCEHVQIDGIKPLLKEAWRRYGLPLAITEAHLSCEREEQLRWIQQIYEAAIELKTEGVDIKGVTFWALFGAYGWDRLLTEAKGNYESGAFDISSGHPRPTAIATMVKELALHGNFVHPVLDQQGWWNRESRVVYPKGVVSVPFSPNASCSPVIVIGATGTLGAAFTRRLADRHIFSLSLNRAQLNVTDVAQIRMVIAQYRPWAIINAAGFVDVDHAEQRKEDCFSSNSLGASNLAQVCHDYGVKLVTFSTDLVFDGEKNAAYVESDEVNPLNIYGLSKADAERKVMAICENALIVRTSAFFGPWDQYNFVAHIRNGLNRNDEMNIADDVYISPTYVPDLVDATIDLLIDDEKGLWHLANVGAVTWYDLAVEVAARISKSDKLIRPMPMANLGLAALRPNFSVLESNRGLIMPSLDNALDRLFEKT